MLTEPRVCHCFDEFSVILGNSLSHVSFFTSQNSLPYFHQFLFPIESYYLIKFQKQPSAILMSQGHWIMSRDIVWLLQSWVGVVGVYWQRPGMEGNILPFIGEPLTTIIWPPMSRVEKYRALEVLVHYIPMLLLRSNERGSPQSSSVQLFT